MFQQPTLGFLAKISFTPLLYHPGRCLGVQRRGKAQETIICLLGPLFISQNEMTFKKATKIIKIHRKLPVFFGCFQSLFNFGWKTAARINYMNLSGSYCFFWHPRPRGGIIVEISGSLHSLLRFLTVFFTISKIKPKVPFINFSVKK